jgi:hypothetical protein
MEAEEDEEDRNNPDGNPNSVGHDPRRTSNEATINANGEQASHEEEEIDVNKLRLDAELLTPALKDFHKEREERDLRKEYMN